MTVRGSTDGEAYEQLLDHASLDASGWGLRASAAVAAERLRHVSQLDQPEREGHVSNFPLKTLPRPKGKGTQVIYTVYDLPRPDASPHDEVFDGPKGTCGIPISIPSSSGSSI